MGSDKSASHDELIDCVETYDLRNYTITLTTMFGDVLREDRYTKDTFPVVFMNLPQGAETYSVTFSVRRAVAD